MGKERSVETTWAAARLLAAPLALLAFGTGARDGRTVPLDGGGAFRLEVPLAQGLDLDRSLIEAVDGANEATFENLELAKE